MSLNEAKKFLRLIIFSVCVLAAAFIAVRAEYQIKSWTTGDGLPQNTVHSIVQTEDGYLWMTTLDGVVRYDGVRFTVFNKNNSAGIVSNRFTKIIEDKQGDLWVGTEESGVTRYHDGEFQTYAVSVNVQTKPIWNMSLDPDGKLVVATETNVVGWNGNEFAELGQFAGKNVESPIFWDKNGAAYYIIGQTLYLMKNGRISEFTLPGEEQIEVRNPFFEDSRGRIWIGTLTAGLVRIENDNLSVLNEKDGLPNGVINPRIEDRDGNVWVTSKHGAVIISPDDEVSRLTVENGLSDDVLTDVRQDREGNIWIGTLYRGLNRATRNSVAFYSTNDGLAAKIVHPIFQAANGDIWLGGGGLTRFSNGVFEKIIGNEKRFGADITSIYQDREGRMWFGNFGTAYYLENGEFVSFLDKFGINAAVYDIHEAADGAMWFATSSGLFRYQDGQVTNLTVADNLISDNVKVILEAADGALWFGTYGGISRLKDGKFQSFTTSDGLASNQVRALYEDADGTFWIGSYDGGLTRFKDGKFTVYTSKDGLFNDGVFQILEDGNQNLWMSSNRGICRVAKQQLNDFADGRLKRIESTAYGKADGLEETECNGGQQPAGIKADDGKLWFPTQNGVAVIDPRKIQTNPVAPPVVIESAAIDNKPVSVGDTIKIAPGENNLQINYTGLSFVKPEQVGFRYKLEGLDDDWVEAGNRRSAYYSYLPPGDYDFRVIAANSDGVWNMEGKSLKIKVVPPFYRTWWFWILCACLMAAAIYLAYRRRISRLENNRRMQENFSRDLLASQERERQRIAAELHDGLGQSLLVIKNRALLGTMSPDDQREAQEQFNEISLASSQALEEVREIAYNLRPYHLDRLGLTQSIKAMLETVNDSTAIEFAFDIMPLENVFPKDEEVIVYRVIQECVNNIVKHSQAGEASVLIHRSDTGITMTIEDNGRGFTPKSYKQTKGGFGLIGLEERVRILGGTLQIRSAPDNGATVIIKELGRNSKTQ